MGPLRRTTTEHDNSNFSRLEASFGKTEVARRGNSIEMKDIYRHTEAGDLDVNELDFDFLLDRSHYPLDALQSLQEIFPAVQHNTHLTNSKNFSEETQIKCFDMNGNSPKWHTLDSQRLTDLVQSIPNPQGSACPTGQDKPDVELPHSNPGRLLVFFIPLIPTKNTSWGSRIAMTQSSTTELFEYLRVNPLFLMNLLGRPDYWAPRTRFHSDINGNLLACDFFCQQPRWNLQFQGAPLSVYMRYCAASNLTTYIISHKQEDTSVKGLHGILNITMNIARSEKRAGIFLDDPFDIAVILSTLSFESSKYHVKRFQRFMWTQVNKVDDHLAGLESNDRRQLSELTKKLQIISQNADSHLGNADVSIITAKAIRKAHARLHKAISSPASVHERAADSIGYVVDSMKKQKIWFLNYKNRKDSTMALVYNLVTQQDAASNIQLAASMKRDSTSMKAIAALTMAFLPGTFTATILSAGNNTDSGIEMSRIWWLWAVITAPLTFTVIACWWYYNRWTHKVQPAHKIIVEGDLSKTGLFRLNSSLWSRKSSTVSKV